MWSLLMPGDVLSVLCCILTRSAFFHALWLGLLVRCVLGVWLLDFVQMLCQDKQSSREGGGGVGDENSTPAVAKNESEPSCATTSTSISQTPEKCPDHVTSHAIQYPNSMTYPAPVPVQYFSSVPVQYSSVPVQYHSSVPVQYPSSVPVQYSTYAWQRVQSPAALPVNCS